ncbi:hypothetical protein QR685DRAFT_217497 [Neurospora intermedia]|uniref:Secreted protein n=1 Tax=Neurospora intermedia TaxID=5142 RepID=A0ABR3DGR8_NEUIN
MKVIPSIPIFSRLCSLYLMFISVNGGMSTRVASLGCGGKEGKCTCRWHFHHFSTYLYLLSISTYCMNSLLHNEQLQYYT